MTLLERERFERVLVFTRTRRGAERLSHILEAREHKVNRIHADRTQPQREAALRGFKEGQTRVLVATDIAARGMDVDSISHVINYDVPAAPEDYVHRIGRTGRAGNVGRAITLVTPVEEMTCVPSNVSQDRRSSASCFRPSEGSVQHSVPEAVRSVRPSAPLALQVVARSDLAGPADNLIGHLKPDRWCATLKRRAHQQPSPP